LASGFALPARKVAKATLAGLRVMWRFWWGRFLREKCQVLVREGWLKVRVNSAERRKRLMHRVRVLAVEVRDIVCGRRDASSAGEVK